MVKTKNFQANVLLQHICKVGNGSIPKPPKKEREMKKSKDKLVGTPSTNSAETPSTSAATSHASEHTAEEKLARYVFTQLIL